MAKAKTKAAKPAKAAAGSKKTRSAAKLTSINGGKSNGGAHKSAPVAETTEAQKARFLQHRTAWIGWQAKLKVVEKIESDVKAALKADGFTVKQFQIADALTGSPKQVAKVQAEVRDRLQVAMWMNHPMGRQLDLFDNPQEFAPPPPSEEAAFEDGKQAAMEGKTGTPPSQFSAGDLAQSWIAGYHVGQEERVKAGIKPLDEKSDEPWAGGDQGAPAAGWGKSNQQQQTVN